MPSQGSPAQPELSVVVASTHSARDLAQFLDTIATQAGRDRSEVIVADASGANQSLDIQTKYPGVLFMSFPYGTALPALWGAGIARSKASIIAVTDTKSTPGDHWLTAILLAHESPHPVIGGAVEGAHRNRLVDWAAYFCEYGQFMLPVGEGVVSELPGNNISFKRCALDRGKEFVQNGFWKTYWCRKLREDGVRLMSIPSIVVYDRKSYRLLPFLIRRFHHGRCFAGMRIEQISLLMRLIYLAGTPVLPWLLLYRMVRAIVPKQRHVREFLLSFPLSVLAMGSWSLGECWGYLFGPGQSCQFIR